MTIKEALNKGTFMLKNNNIETPKLKARLLLQFTLNKTREYLIIYDNESISQDKEVLYFKYIDKLIQGIPLQYITNTQEFMKMSFFVNDNVLIPQPDTEILVEETIKIARNIKKPTILDLCTGSGAIAVSLKKYLQDSIVYASDISPKALEVAKRNAKNNNVEVNFFESDLFENLPNIKFDIIVSNPPYIKKDVIKTLDKEVQNEPKLALDGGIDGLDFYRKIVNDGYHYLKYNSYLCLEIGYNQKEEVMEIIKNERKYINTYCLKDLYDNNRVIVTKVGD